MKVRFMFLRNTKNIPIGCLAIMVNGTMVNYSWSVLNPMDDFNRSLAREIAEGRLRLNYQTLFINGSSEKISVHQVSNSVMSHLSTNKFAPARARRAAKRWLQLNSRTKG